MTPLWSPPRGALGPSPSPLLWAGAGPEGEAESHSQPHQPQSPEHPSTTPNPGPGTSPMAHAAHLPVSPSPGSSPSHPGGQRPPLSPSPGPLWRATQGHTHNLSHRPLHSPVQYLRVEVQDRRSMGVAVASGGLARARVVGLGTTLPVGAGVGGSEGVPQVVVSGVSLQPRAQGGAWGGPVLSPPPPGRGSKGASRAGGSGGSGSGDGDGGGGGGGPNAVPAEGTAGRSGLEDRSGQEAVPAGGESSPEVSGHVRHTGPAGAIGGQPTPLPLAPINIHFSAPMALVAEALAGAGGVGTGVRGKRTLSAGPVGLRRRGGEPAPRPQDTCVAPGPGLNFGWGAVGPGGAGPRSPSPGRRRSQGERGGQRGTGATASRPGVGAVGIGVAQQDATPSRLRDALTRSLKAAVAKGTSSGGRGPGTGKRTRPRSAHTPALGAGGTSGPGTVAGAGVAGGPQAWRDGGVGVGAGGVAMGVSHAVGRGPRVAFGVPHTTR